MVKADVLKTHGSNKKILKLLNFKKFTHIDEGVKNSLNWYLKIKYIKFLNENYLRLSNFLNQKAGGPSRYFCNLIEEISKKCMSKSVLQFILMIIYKS